MRRGALTDLNRAATLYPREPAVLFAAAAADRSPAVLPAFDTSPVRILQNGCRRMPRRCARLQDAAEFSATSFPTPLRVSTIILRSDACGHRRRHTWSRNRRATAGTEDQSCTAEIRMARDFAR